jgi:polyhydroxyalkanoate synthesis regulator phasin
MSLHSNSVRRGTIPSPSTTLWVPIRSNPACIIFDITTVIRDPRDRAYGGCIATIPSDPMSDPTSPSPTVRHANGHFAKGNPGGPGRPRNAVCRAAPTLDEIGAEAAEAIVRSIVDKALAGDTRAAEMILSRAWPMRRGRPVEIPAPDVNDPSDVVSANAAVASAVMQGEITPEEGRAFSAVLETQRHAFETVEMETKMEALQDRVARLKEQLR